jgi:hypothetical protein
MPAIFNASMTIPACDFTAVDGTLKFSHRDMKYALFAILAVAPNTILWCVGPGIGSRDVYDQTHKTNEEIPHVIMLIPLLIEY